jgi:thiosulfate reductase cytochrome b subunit
MAPLPALGPVERQRSLGAASPRWTGCLRISLSLNPGYTHACSNQPNLDFIVALSEPDAVTKPAGEPAVKPQREVIYRHSVVVRLTHWINALILVLLLASGLSLFNYHPALYWGSYGYSGVPSVLSIAALEDIETGDPVGVTTIMGRSFITTGVLGVSYDAEGEPITRAFPQWLTSPGGLAMARDLHFAAAWLLVLNGLAYMLFGLFTGHFRRDLMPSAEELRPRHLVADVWNHIRLRRPRGEAARRYNILQKLAYVIVIFILLPVMVLTGLTMSPAVTAAMPFLFDIFAGRQSARTIHFLVANLLVLFVLIHLVQVIVTGVFNNMRSMITGRYAIPPEDKT